MDRNCATLPIDASRSGISGRHGAAGKRKSMYCTAFTINTSAGPGWVSGSPGPRPMIRISRSVSVARRQAATGGGDGVVVKRRIGQIVGHDLAPDHDVDRSLVGPKRQPRGFQPKVGAIGQRNGVRLVPERDHRQDRAEPRDFATGPGRPAPPRRRCRPKGPWFCCASHLHARTAAREVGSGASDRSGHHFRSAP